MTSNGSILDWLTAHRVLASGCVLGATLVLLLALHVFARGLQRGKAGWAQRLRERLGIVAGHAMGEMRWMLISAHLLAWPLTIGALLHLWGQHATGRAFLTGLLSEGFTLAGIHIVPGRLLFGAIVFLGLLTVMRWLRQRMERNWLHRSGIERSTREAVATLFGYAAFAFAALVGLSLAGFDFTKLAIVAGALSVGIGFGLQNVVNNFVSGLIILFEQPIRTGDYIIIGDTQGFVRRIRIRSTEIETWDRETVIVPNSDLLSSHLKNYNLRDRYGRVTVPVGVAYGSDTDLVRRTLLEVGSGHPQVVRAGETPGVDGPSVIFADFGDSSLDFHLRVYVRDVDKRVPIASELRFAIDAAFRKVGVEIPFPQRDVWLRGLPKDAAMAPPPGPIQPVSGQ